MKVSGQIKRTAKVAINWPGILSARLRARTGRAARFSGAYATRDAALASLPDQLRAGYDDSTVAEVSFDWMCKRAAWDYPLLFWIKTLLPEGGTILDAGGHLGTKYIAFRDVLNLGQFNWIVYDLPGIIAAARARQAQSDIPADIVFCDQTDALPDADLLIASGFLQYLDTPLARFLADLPKRPTHILINKLPLRLDETVFTIERIGQAQVPYQIRSHAVWQAEIADAGYRVVDTWEIPGLAHVIATHPVLGTSESRGYMLVRNDTVDESYAME